MPRQRVVHWSCTRKGDTVIIKAAVWIDECYFTSEFCYFTTTHCAAKFGKVLGRMVKGLSYAVAKRLGHHAVPRVRGL